MIDEVEKAVLGLQREDGGGPYLGRFGTAHDGPEQYRDRGHNLIRVPEDIILFKNGSQEVQVLKINGYRFLSYRCL